MCERRMDKMEPMHKVQAALLVLACTLGLSGCRLNWTAEASSQTDEQSGRPSELRIENEAQLPDTYPQAPYQQRLQAHGSVMTLHWRLENGSPPPGMKLEDDGLLHGQAQRRGEFEFRVSVREGDRRDTAVQKTFHLRVVSALNLKWKTTAHVSGNRIEGSVDVSNTTPDDVDLTFIVLAVPPDGRATAIGYQHFMLPHGTAGKELPFGETLPHGGYVVNVDAVGEVESKNLIYRDRLVTPSALEVTVGP